MFAYSDQLHVVSYTDQLYMLHVLTSCACLHCRDMLDASPGVSWDDIAGLAEAKRVLQENVILPLYMPEYFQGIRRPVKVCLIFPCFVRLVQAPALVTCADWTSPCHVCRLDQPLSHVQLDQATCAEVTDH